GRVRRGEPGRPRADPAAARAARGAGARDVPWPVARRDRGPHRDAARDGQGPRAPGAAVDPGRPAGRTTGGPPVTRPLNEAEALRAQELLIDRAIAGVDAAEAAELAALGADGDDSF